MRRCLLCGGRRGIRNYINVAASLGVDGGAGVKKPAHHGWNRYTKNTTGIGYE